MEQKLFTKILCAAGIVAASSSYAIDYRVNGFMSIVGGQTVDEGVARTNGVEGDATYLADVATEGSYDNDISFKPDSNFGLQITADLDDGLSVTGQLTANGGEDFKPDLAWAYLSYEVNDSVTVQVGRQRLPLFFYSDYLDVGYAYHWTRIPQSLPGAAADTLEGIKLFWTPSTGDWAWRIQAYFGSADEDLTTSLGDLTFTLEDSTGAVISASNDWLELRLATSQSDIAVTPDSIGAMFSNNTVPAFSDEDPNKVVFTSAAVKATFGDAFVVTEWAQADYDTPHGTDIGIGTELEEGWYVSAGITIEEFTPHITYGEYEDTFSQDTVIYDLTCFVIPPCPTSLGTPAGTIGKKAVAKHETITVGLRWDFHQSAALKAEYVSRSDESDDLIKTAVGAGGNGDQFEVDVFTVGFDLVF